MFDRMSKNQKGHLKFSACTLPSLWPSCGMSGFQGSTDFTLLFFLEEKLLRSTPQMRSAHTEPSWDATVVWENPEINQLPLLGKPKFPEGFTS